MSDSPALSPPPHWGRAAGSTARAVLAHPGLWLAALVTLRRLARPGWWRHWPFLPLPPPAYWRFRLITAYGGEGDTSPSATDTRAYLRWCQRMRRRRG